MNNEIIARCFVKKDGDLWIAVCIDFCLASQGETLQEAKIKLEKQVVFYVEEALQDKEYGSQLLNRKAPLWRFLEYYLITCLQTINKFHKRGKDSGIVFYERMPLRLV